ncbi:MAG: T9SS type A sorting domain-containing protein [Bacteroidota bacterium]
MKRYLLPAILFLMAPQLSWTQSTYQSVYKILEEKCASCHGNASPQSGLDLEGSGATVSARAADVYDNLVWKQPENSYAQGKRFSQIYPGRPDRSFLFRKVNNGLEQTIQLDAQEGGVQPPVGHPALSKVERELIRQWILFGAPADGTVVKESLLDDYYNKNGIASFPDGPPPAPAEGEGFQIKMGPFYLEPAGSGNNELEFFQKYELELPDDVDVNRIDIQISNYSHHFIVYSYENPSDATAVNHGMRLNPYHKDVNLVTAVQEATDLKLPNGTAFIWDNDIVLDLNSHYINYSANATYQAEAYLNVYTQAARTAKQEMRSELVANVDIFIPNNGTPTTFNEALTDDGLGEIFVWGLMGHTHQYGTGYKIYKREGGRIGDIIYDGACAQGVPNCLAPEFDYQHIPLRYFDEFLPIDMRSGNGLIHSAEWVNDGPRNVWFGLTSEDEMMVMIMMYLTDTTGLSQTTTSIGSPLVELPGLRVHPNPMREQTTFYLPPGYGELQITIYDLLGRQLRSYSGQGGTMFNLERGTLEKGMYVYKVEDSSGRVASGKLLLE